LFLFLRSPEANKRKAVPGIAKATNGPAPKKAKAGAESSSSEDSSSDEEEEAAKTTPACKHNPIALASQGAHFRKEFVEHQAVV